ncbi:MAG: DUF4003 family protein [Senegalia sp. (in: firmicutes)]|uniref:DUF4003 family protein n=1 Tax=Senegalia sp. (in: firmicutes) TaxID=1924098 RepID=UPI003F9AB88D
MKFIYEERIKNMMENYEELRQEFKWENDMSRHLIALSYAMKGKEINITKIKEIKEYIKNKTGMFSPLRGHMTFVLSGLLNVNVDNPKEEFDNMLSNEKILKENGFKYSSYLPTALYSLSSVYKGDDVRDYTKKAMDIYKDMKKNHPFLTSGDDYALAILLASTDHSTDLLENYYEELNNRGFSKSNGLQMLSHIMAFSESSIRDTVNKCENIHNNLRSNKLKISTDYYPAIGLISLIDGNENELMNDFVEIADYLRNQKRYKWLGKGMNVLIASAIISSEYIKEQKESSIVNTTLSISIETIIAAQQAAMIAAIAASTAAASSAGN